LKYFSSPPKKIYAQFRPKAGDGFEVDPPSSTE
jgi:hypothetical protein